MNSGPDMIKILDIKKLKSVTFLSLSGVQSLLCAYQLIAFIYKSRTKQALNSA